MHFITKHHVPEISIEQFQLNPKICILLWRRDVLEIYIIYCPYIWLHICFPSIVQCKYCYVYFIKYFLLCSFLLFLQHQHIFFYFYTKYQIANIGNCNRIYFSKSFHHLITNIFFLVWFSKFSLHNFLFSFLWKIYVFSFYCIESLYYEYHDNENKKNVPNK